MLPARRHFLEGAANLVIRKVDVPTGNPAQLATDASLGHLEW